MSTSLDTKRNVVLICVYTLLKKLSIVIIMLEAFMRRVSHKTLFNMLCVVLEYGERNFENRYRRKAFSIKRLIKSGFFLYDAVE